jgi:integral membrane protein
MKLYKNLYLELFIDLYLVCAFLAILPLKVRQIVRFLFYLIGYCIAIVDVYCFTKFDSTLNPTMLLLMFETDSREAGEFLRSCLSADVLLGGVGHILLLMLFNIVLAFHRSLLKLFCKNKALCSFVEKVRHFFEKPLTSYITAGLITLCLLLAIVTTAHNKGKVYKLLTAQNIGDAEHQLTENEHAELYLPLYRLAFSLYANSLVSQQLDRLIEVSKKVDVDSCEFTSPDIVLIIGESYNRHHSSQYGYIKPTTPRQIKRQKQGRLIPFTDVVSPWNLTSFVFKHMFSTYTVGDKGEWCDYPLFPELFRKAGYHVTFITNQFLPKAGEAVYDLSGGFFLNNAELSKAQFDTRNDKLHTYDEGLLHEYDSLKEQSGKNNLFIFHLIGQHVNYRQRSPDDRKKFKGEDYKELKPNHNDRERRILSDYDNAILYNDSIVDQIIRRFEKKEAIVIYVPDHGEECFEGDMHFFCRLHSAKIDARLAHAEFDIPFWIWCSTKYSVRHPEIVRAIRKARNRKYMTDALPHLLLYLGGIKTSAYKEEYNLISPNYNEQRKRLLKGTTDYDSLK